MATVTGFTATRMLGIENNSVVSGTISGDDLILTRQGGGTINAGNVRGPQGDQGISGSVATELGGSVDLNTITTPGRYTQTANAEAATGSNYPVPSAGYLEVAADPTGSMVWQRYTVYRGTSFAVETFSRALYSSVWSAWSMLGGSPSPFLSRYRNATMTMVSGTEYTVDFNGSDSLLGGMTYSAGTVTVPRAGLYNINAHVHIQSSSTAGTFSLIVRVNAGKWRQLNTKMDGANESRSISVVALLDAGDTIDIRASQSSGVDATLYGVAPGIRYTALDITYQAS